MSYAGQKYMDAIISDAEGICMRMRTGDSHQRVAWREVVRAEYSTGKPFSQSVAEEKFTRACAGLAI